MKKAKNLACLIGILALAFLATGCSDSRTSESATPKQVVKFRSYPKSAVGIPKGLVVEKQGAAVTATLYDLKDGNGFVIDSQLATGRYWPDKNAIILPIGLTPLISAEDWIAQDGPRMEIPIGQSATNLFAMFKSLGPPGMSIELLRFVE